MHAKELTDTLAVTIEKGYPLMIKGPPGCAKTALVLLAAKKAKAEVVLMHPVVSDPTEFKGLPGFVKMTSGKTRAVFLPFGELRRLITAKKKTICFLDDLGQAPAVVQAACMQLILARRINGHKVSEHVVFIAATNRREDRAGVTGILEPVKSRFHTILELMPNIEDWSEWALANGVPPEVVAFVRFKPALILDPGPATNDLVNRPSPRTVVHMAELYGAGLKSLEVLGGAVGQGMAIEFLGFIKIWQSMPSLDMILAAPMATPVPTEIGALFAVATGLAFRVNKENAGNAIKYLGRLPDEYSVLGMRDACRQFPGVKSNPEFLKWAVAHQDVLT